LARLLREAIEADRYPMSPRVRWLKALPAKLRPTSTATGGAAAAETAGRAKHGVDEEAAQKPPRPPSARGVGPKLLFGLPAGEAILRSCLILQNLPR